MTRYLLRFWKKLAIHINLLTLLQYHDIKYDEFYKKDISPQVMATTNYRYRNISFHRQQLPSIHT